MRLKITLAILGVLLLASISGVWFYWFEWRPNEIRKVCSEEAANKADSEFNKYIKALAPTEAGKEISERTDSLYRECLTKHGLER